MGYATVRKKSRIAVNGAVSLLSKEDPSGYFSEPVDLALVPGYTDVVSVVFRHGRKQHLHTCSMW